MAVRACHWERACEEERETKGEKGRAARERDKEEGEASRCCSTGPLRCPERQAGGADGGLLGASTHLLEVEDKREVLLIAPWAFEISLEVYKLH
jgi:hypothetical protein